MSLYDESVYIGLSRVFFTVAVLLQAATARIAEHKAAVDLRFGIACFPSIPYHIAISLWWQCTARRALLKQIIDGAPMFRLRQRHSLHLHDASPPVSADRLMAAQSVRAAITGAAITIIVVNILWMYTASATARYLPWIAIIQGAAIGLAVRKSGRGLDWRFPLIAGAAAWVGAFSGNLFIALLFTTADNGAVSNSWWRILQSFFASTVSVIDVIYAFCAVAIATFYSKRRLNRHEVLALRKNREE